MIQNKTARKLLYEWHNGQFCPLYCAASSGLVENFDYLKTDIDILLSMSLIQESNNKLERLLEWINNQEKCAKKGIANDRKEYWFLPWAVKKPLK